MQSLVKQAFSDAGYDIHTAESGAAALELVTRRQYDGFIVDPDLPDREGFELIRELRCSGVSSPILILTARRTVEDRVKGLELGGDDYLAKPFAMAELLVRMRNLLRHASAQIGKAACLRVCDLELDLLKRRAVREGEVLNLSPQEFVLLEYLCRHAGRVVTRSMLLAEVWGMRVQPDTNVIDVHIYRLRRKIDTEGREPLITTLRGVGYLLKAC